jgi:hypothetical protein
MPALIAGPHLIDAILCLVAAEFVALQVLRARRGSGPSGLDILFNLLSGVFLLLAVRAALSGAAPAWLLIWLAAALVAHLADLIRRLRR